MKLYTQSVIKTRCLFKFNNLPENVDDHNTRSECAGSVLNAPSHLGCIAPKVSERVALIMELFSVTEENDKSSVRPFCRFERRCTSGSRRFLINNDTERQVELINIIGVLFMLKRHNSVPARKYCSVVYPLQIKAKYRSTVT